mmetsp:Transcript_24675/g.38383  ORF Transcript_24675/g.38383 Transcript_24675/m.38383 type:complete len:122 (+) Transcript_24675:1500-1865(+)
MDDYWSYGIDHIARWDVYGFLTRILEIKVTEFKEMEPEACRGLSDIEIKKLVRAKLKITYIGHSLGGMILPMYLVYSKMLGREDNLLHKSILLSPAGTHFHANWLINLVGQYFSYVSPMFA